MHLDAAEVKSFVNDRPVRRTSVMRDDPERSRAIVDPVARQGRRSASGDGEHPDRALPAAGVDLFMLQLAADRTVLAELLLEPSQSRTWSRRCSRSSCAGAAGSPRLAHLRRGAEGRVRESDPVGRPLGAVRRLARAASLRRLARGARRGALRRLVLIPGGGRRETYRFHHATMPFTLRAPARARGKNGRTSRSRSRSRSARSTASPS